MAFNSKLIPEMNIGLVGHVDCGKTTLVQSLSGKWTDTHSEEIKRGITIRIGYADVSIRKCPKCEGYKSYKTSEKCPEHGENTEVLRTISLVDAPGHETLMANVLSGAAIMDGALLLISADEKCPQPQTKEHLAVLDIVGIKNIIIVQNKIDLVSEERAKESYKEILNFIKGTIAENSPIIPISARYGLNIDVLLQTIEKSMPTPKRNKNAPLKMLIARSFDVNRPGTRIEDLHGGVVGGSILCGSLCVGEEIEIKPGIKNNGVWQSIITNVKNIRQGNMNIKEGLPGGLLAIETSLDPALTKADRLVGGVLGKKGSLGEIYQTLGITMNLMNHVLGSGDEEEIKPLKMGELLLLNVGTAKISGVVTKLGKQVQINLNSPVYAEEGQKVVISRRIGSRWRLIGYGIIQGS